MGKIMRKGRVVILLAGRRSGKKAIIVKSNDDGGKKERRFPHALVCGIERCPRKVTRAMSATKAERKSRMKPFVKYVNYNHMLPTRFMIKDDFEFRALATEDKMNTAEGKKGLVKELKSKFMERYMQNAGGEKQATADFLFKKLRF